MASFESCLTSLDLGDKLATDELKAVAAQYEAEGMEKSAAILRAAEDQLQLAQMEERNILATVRSEYEKRGGKVKAAPKAKPEPAPLDHGELNIPGRTKNIDKELDKYKAEQAKEAKSEAKSASAQKKLDKARARELFDEVADDIVAKNGAKFGVKELRNELDQMVKWEPAKFIKLAETFKKEQEAAKAEPYCIQTNGDGYATDRDYGVEVLRTAFAVGAEVGVLCDTNGGMLPMGVGRVVADVRARVEGRLGIHCQDDTGCAVANTLAAVEAGVTHVQGTANGYGERAGNADTFALIANLVTKMGLPVVPEGCLAELQRVSHAIAELANIAPDEHQPYVGASAFAHKAGLHASAIKVSPELYNHLDPALVGNDMRILVTEMAGRASVELKGRELGVDLDGHADVIGRVVDRVKVLEADGWSFEAADASFELLLRAELPDSPPPLFELESYRTSVEHWGNGVVVSEATVKVHVDGQRVISTGEGNGPVNALDNALRQALVGRYPQLADVSLADYKVRILGWKGGSSATTRVLIDTTDGVGEWTTVGVHDNIVEASWHALVDALTYSVRHR